MVNASDVVRRIRHELHDAMATRVQDESMSRDEHKTWPTRRSTHCSIRQRQLAAIALRKAKSTEFTVLREAGPSAPLNA